ncbi:amidase [Thalassotalea ganghwensis]
MSLIRFVVLITALYALNTNAIEQPASTIKGLQQQLSEGTISSEQLVNYYITRIKQVDQAGPTLNSVSQLNANAITRAKALDAMRKKGELLGEMHGIPVLLKDNIDTVDDMSNSAGSIALAQHFPADDAFLVQQLKNVGAIILGKTNLSEWANFRSTASSSGWSSLYGQTKNPYDITRSPCGSSSGSGVAVAAELATVAIGTETDGSVTCPSAINGIVGIKPTLGTVSRDGIIPIAHSQDTAGPMARTVSDAVILLDAITAFDHNDRDALKVTTRYSQHLKHDGLKGKRIGVVRSLTGYHHQLDQVFEQAIADLREQGAIIVDELAIESEKDWASAEFDILLYEFKTDLNAYLKTTKSELPKSLNELIAFNQANASKAMPYFNQEIFEMAQAKGDLTSKEYLTALKQAKQASQADGIDKLLAEHKLDLLIAPTTGPAWKIDWVNGDHYLGAASSAAAVAGYPHITVPMGYIHKLPVGISFFGTKLSEPTLIEAAFSYEQATKHRKAPF